MSNSTKTIALFGATGGTGLATLKLCLQAGHTVQVLARTPSKLEYLPPQYPNLRIIQGDILDISSVKSTLLINNRIVDTIISAIGMAIEMKGLGFSSKTPHICEQGTKAILSALSQFESQDGISGPAGAKRVANQRDIPITMIPLYQWMLSTPHADKKKMEEAMIAGEGKGRKWVCIRPSFLNDGESKGLGKVRVSAETSESPKEQKDMAIGYVISRNDVAKWIFEECVKGDAKRWEGKMVTLTY
ncbi:NAD(P)-binding protein [Acephala macrosclerotiorum]|nr:NAD(P)-binding protein [Acephala macrosclerotiorum]